MGKKKQKQVLPEDRADAAAVQVQPDVKDPTTGVERTEELATAYRESLRGEETLGFYRSLVALEADDIAPKDPASGRRVWQQKLLLILIFCLFLGVFVYSAWTAIYDVVTYKLAEENYNWLSDNFSMETDRSMTERLYAARDALALPDFSEMLSGDFVYKEVTTGKEEAQLAIYRTKLEMLKAKNPDTYGWISIEGTNIDYPVMQGEDNEYYLDHDFSCNSYSAGSIYIDYRCLPNLSENWDAVIYGHNIRTRGIMFNQLLRYMDQSFFNAHPYIKIYTPDGIYTYTIFSFFQTTYDSGYAELYFNTAEEFTTYCNAMRLNSWYQRSGMDQVVFTRDSRLLTLSTCTNGAKNERFAVVALLTDRVENPSGDSK